MLQPLLVHRLAAVLSQESLQPAQRLAKSLRYQFSWLMLSTDRLDSASEVQGGHGRPFAEAAEMRRGSRLPNGAQLEMRPVTDTINQRSTSQEAGAREGLFLTA